MAGAAIHVFPGYEAGAQALADATGLPLHMIDIHTFPDGESRVKVVPCAGTVILFAGLDHPDAKMLPLIFAAQALRENGAARGLLLCPYLAYMRQDKAFSEGEAVSQRIVGPLLARYIDRIITVDPHLHRVAALSEVMPGIEADSLSAAPLIGEVIGYDAALSDAILIGPDGEARQWVAAAAKQADLPFLVASKVRRGDRDVVVTLPEAARASGRPAVIVDDLISSGATICRAAELLTAAGAARVEAIGVHVFADGRAVEAMKAAGVARVRSSDSIRHASNAFGLTPLYVTALEKEYEHGH